MADTEAATARAARTVVRHLAGTDLWIERGALRTALPAEDRPQLDAALVRLAAAGMLDARCTRSGLTVYRGQRTAAEGGGA